MKDNKLIFWTGAPGSKWSATAWCLSKTKKIDIDTTDPSKAKEIAENICKSLLANMVIEDFSIEILTEK